MQPLNDDMDDLFRRASEEYPLNTQGADWNKVMQQLDHKEEALPEENKKKKDFRSLWLLLLLPIGFICGRYIGDNGKQEGITAVNEIKTVSAPTVKNSPANTATKKPSVEVKGINPGGEDVKGETSGAKKFGKVSTIYSETEGSKSTSGSGNPTLMLNNKKLGKGSKAGTNVDDLLTKDVLPEEGKSNSENKQAGSGRVSRPLDELDINNKAGASGNYPADVTAKQIPEHDETLITKDASAEKGSDKQAVKNADLKEKIAATEKSNTQKPTTKHNLSYSIVFGPDISTVKNQKTSKLGYSAGVLLRYQLSGRISLEGGVLWARKNYYSEGKYLDTSKLKLPIRSIVKTAEGYCNMFEIPLNVRYDLITKKNHFWFLSAGVSSYLMKQEEYDLSYERYNQLYTKNYAYSNSSKDWFSIMNLSIGYQKSLGKNATLGIAPYIKLPLKGVGIGKLPVTSTGVYLTLSRSTR